MKRGRLLDVQTTPGWRIMSDEGYNGWKNYPTWAVHLWITNEPGPYEYALTLTEGAAGTERPRVELADALREWIREKNEPATASLSSDLLGYALDQVDWFEVADAFLETRHEVTS